MEIERCSPCFGGSAAKCCFGNTRPETEFRSVQNASSPLPVGTRELIVCGRRRGASPCRSFRSGRCPRGTKRGTGRAGRDGELRGPSRVSSARRRPILPRQQMEVEMKMVKSLLLGTAAGLVAVAGAQAADMPVKAAPVQYVKICSLYGDGFYYIPGTDTCLKLGGYLRVQAEYNAGAGGIVVGNGAQEAGHGRFTPGATHHNTHPVRAAATTNTSPAARGVPAGAGRQRTECGRLRTSIRFGVPNEPPAGTGGGSTPSAFWDRAFMQFAGFTVGRSQSFFDLFTYGGAYSYHNVRVSGDTGASGQNLWAYTAQFGNGFSGTLSLEDPATRKVNGTVDVTNTNGGLGFFAFNGVVANDNGLTINPTFGFRVPDVV